MIRGTEFIRMNTGNCEACWECIERCTNEVFGKIVFFGHRHAKIKNPDRCTGCMKCLKACKYHAISLVNGNNTFNI